MKHFFLQLAYISGYNAVLLWKISNLAGKSPSGLAFIQADEERGERQVIVKVPEPAALFGLQGFLVCGSRAIKMQVLNKCQVWYSWG